ncbi:hypothetical protein [Mogibacterium diversum]|uniref:hypothetical protein n=1 Tax=Mogibacterium diversum TaxID=114527 RepID=UPI001CB07CAF|nr:hypothetical protein [Mogibacterium diversum]MBF1319996.1 hypothetical protein [Mogibacterium diversum]
MLYSMNVFALEGDSDRPLALDENGLLENRVEGETVNPDAYLETTGDRANNNTNNEHVIHVTKNGVTYTIGYALNSSTILPEEINGMDSDQALEYIANKSMTFYTDRNATVIPDIVFGRDYFVRVNGLTHVTPDTLRGSYRLEIANNSGFNNAATTTVTIGNSGNGGNGGSGGNTGAGNVDRTNTNGHSTAANVVQSLARRISSGTRVRGANRAVSAARANQVKPNASLESGAAGTADKANNSSESSSSSSSAAGHGSGSAGRGVASSRAVETVANAATAGAGAGSAWLAVLIISDIKLLLWYKKLKEAKRKSVL